VVCDRATDLAGILLLGAVALPTLRPESPRWTLIALLAVAVVAVLAGRPLRRRIALRFSQSELATAGNRLGAVAASAVGCSLVIWSLDVTRIILVGAAFSVRLTPSQGATISLLRLGSGLVPIPAGIGVVDGALVAGFIWLGLSSTTAAALAIVERAIVYGWGTLLGAAALLLLGGSQALKRARAGGNSFDFSSEPSA
jgi:uncharacterized membrane protein YbhN (UPF0104 family)